MTGSTARAVNCRAIFEGVQDLGRESKQVSECHLRRTKRGYWFFEVPNGSVAISAERTQRSLRFR